MPITRVLDSTIHYVDRGSGRAVVLLHGNPTSSHLWRRVLTAIQGEVRLLAPDMIGMGASGSPDIAYDFADHAAYFDAWLDALKLDEIVLVGHDWGGALALDWARRHPAEVRGVVLLETILRPLSWSQFPERARPVFRALRAHGSGEQMVLHDNVFIEQALPAGVATGLSPADHAAYRAPYPTPDSRRPLLAWSRAMPLDGQPADVVARVEAYGTWLAGSPSVPKLLLSFDPGPGIMIGPDLVAWARAHVAGLEVEHCGAAGHHAPEDQPYAIAAAISGWLRRHGLDDAPQV